MSDKLLKIKKFELYDTETLIIRLQENKCIFIEKKDLDRIIRDGLKIKDMTFEKFIEFMKEP